MPEEKKAEISEVKRRILEELDEDLRRALEAPYDEEELYADEEEEEDLPRDPWDELDIDKIRESKKKEFRFTIHPPK